MKTLKSLTILPLSSTLLLAVGCDVKQELGETAGTSSGGDSESDSTESGGTTGGSAETGVLDTGPWSGTSDGTTGGGVETGVLDTGPWSGTETGEETGSTSGGPQETCEPADPLVTWNADSIAPAELDYKSTFVGVGSCEVAVAMPDASAFSLILDCTLSGTRDGDDFVDEEISTTLDFEVSGGDPYIPSFWPVVSARIVVGTPGFEQASSRYVVLEQQMLPNDGAAPVVIASQGLGLRPNEAQVSPWFDQPWFGGPSISTTDASCVTGDAPSCGFDVAIEAGWLDLVPIAVHGTEAGEFGAPTDGGSYDLYVDSAWEAPKSFECGEDFPGAIYRFVALGATE